MAGAVTLLIVELRHRPHGKLKGTHAESKIR
jgi:hypothetical protein